MELVVSLNGKSKQIFNAVAGNIFPFNCEIFSLIGSFVAKMHNCLTVIHRFISYGKCKSWICLRCLSITC